MNSSSSPCCQKAATFLGVLGAFLVVGLLVYVMRQSTPAPAFNAARAQERTNALAEIRNANAKALGTYEVTDPGKQAVRLTIQRAMELTVQEYKNPVAARTNLIARAEKANERPPEKTNQIEKPSP